VGEAPDLRASVECRTKTVVFLDGPHFLLLSCNSLCKDMCATVCLF
jgi:hypothetical protein